MPDVAESELELRLRRHGRFEPTPVVALGSIIGGWKVLACLGRGGSAEVYRAENATTGIVGALKILYRADDKARARFKREVQLSAELPGTGFPKFYGAGEDSGRLYLAEELLEPMALPCGDAAVAFYMLAVSRAVEELHKRGFVHRDIKPANVMVRPSTGECVLIDLGLAKDGDTLRSRNDTLSVVDGHAVGVGTPGFSAPEQFTGGRIGVASDIHALGVLANVCFDGRPPPAWAKIIRRSTSSIPEQRYASVAEFARAVCHRHEARWWTCAAAVGLAAVGVSAILAVLTRKDWSRSQPEALQENRGVIEGTENENRTLIRDTIAEALLDATYDMYRDAMTETTNEVGESVLLDREAAKELMKQGVLPWY